MGEVGKQEGEGERGGEWGVRGKEGTGKGNKEEGMGELGEWKNGETREGEKEGTETEFPGESEVWCGPDQTIGGGWVGGGHYPSPATLFYRSLPLFPFCPRPSATPGVLLAQVQSGDPQAGVLVYPLPLLVPTFPPLPLASPFLTPPPGVHLARVRSGDARAGVLAIWHIPFPLFHSPPQTKTPPPSPTRYSPSPSTNLARVRSGGVHLARVQSVDARAGVLPSPACSDPFSLLHSPRLPPCSPPPGVHLARVQSGDAMYAADEVWKEDCECERLSLVLLCVRSVFGSPTLPDAMYAADETPMVSYLNLHAVLNVRRVEAARSLMRAKQQLAQLQQQQQQLQYQHQQRQQQHPHHQQQYQHQLQRLQRHKQQLENKINSLVLTKVPRVLLVGPTDSGKSTLGRMLLCWAARQQWHPTYVDLDVAHSSVTVPGAVAATPVEAPLEANARTVEEAPLVLFYGHTNPSANLDLYRALVTALADATDRRLGITPLGDGGGGEEGGGDGGTAGAGAGREAAGEAAAIGAAAIGAVPVEAAAAGIIANSMGWVDGAGYQLLLHSIDALRANVVLVLGQERLYSMLSEHYRSKAAAAAADGIPAGHAAAVEVVKLVRSGGAVSRASKFRQRLRQAVIKAYFYGPERQFSPHSSTSSWSEYTVLRVGGGPQAPQSALPIGAARVSDPLRTAPVVLSRELEHHVLAVSHAKEEKDAVTG
ncbi:unnamed protein product [Closterium sp. Naga37s-1]|nr:unnamed protein product [Closterium sp. Naga37s-1]